MAGSKDMNPDLEPGVQGRGQKLNPQVEPKMVEEGEAHLYDPSPSLH